MTVRDHKHYDRVHNYLKIMEREIELWREAGDSETPLSPTPIAELWAWMQKNPFAAEVVIKSHAPEDWEYYMRKRMK